ncbi:PEP-CTERM sorting domain-containing protein [Altericroceibacterium xinjiangense]|uniref:PEP-CTERM sorting domain-containing protein n=1 Tax=Altericroceibacterium xinjiangense TaxID=762261 RepID=UPI000F7DAF06|nr:PEP-CTERM sorting domain-containing protein [Altericroceibacterium xinjiangense]
MVAAHHIKSSLKALGLGALLLAGTAAPASAATFLVNLTGLNNSGVTGSATLELNEIARTLSVALNASGLAQGAHIGHIHGRFDSSGNAIDSITPPASADTDGDGFVELGEGALFYGPILLPLSGIGDVGADGILNYSQTFDLSDTGVFADSFSSEDLFPLTFREIVLHGANVPANAGAGTGGIIDGTQGTYSLALPVASGEIVAAIPEPATWGMLLVGFFGVGGMIRSTKRKRQPTLSFS